MELVKHREKVFAGKFTRIVFAIPHNSMYQHFDYVDQMRQHFKDLEVVEGIADPKKMGLLDDVNEHKLLILDDLVLEMLSTLFLVNIFLKESHHSSLSISRQSLQTIPILALT